MMMKSALSKGSMHAQGEGKGGGKGIVPRRAGGHAGARGRAPKALRLVGGTTGSNVEGGGKGEGEWEPKEGELRRAGQEEHAD